MNYKIYVLLLVGLCMSLLSCSDDTEELDKAAAAPTIQFPMEELNIDLNKADNLPVVAIVKSSVGLKEVRMTIQREGSSEEYKSVTSFFNPNSYSLAESLNYEADYKSFVVEAIDKLDRVTSATLFFSITDIMEQPQIIFNPEEIVYDEMEDNPVMPRTYFTVTAEAGLKQIDMYRVSSEGQMQYGQSISSFENPNEYVFDELIEYKENDRGFKVKVEDLYGNIKIATLKISYLTAPAPELSISETEIYADKDESKPIHVNVTSAKGLRALIVYRTENGEEQEFSRLDMNGEHEWNGDLNVTFTNATSRIRVVADDGKKQSEATAVAYVNMVYQQVQLASQFAYNIPNSKYPDVYSLFSIKDMKSYSVDYALANNENASNVDFKFYCFGSQGEPRFYSMDEGSKNGEYGKLGNIGVKNKTRFVRLNSDFDFDNATVASIEKALSDGTIVSSQMTASITKCETGNVIAFKTGGTSASGANRYGLIKIISITPAKEIISTNPTARVVTFTIKMPKQ